MCTRRATIMREGMCTRRAAIVREGMCAHGERQSCDARWLAAGLCDCDVAVPAVAHVEQQLCGNEGEKEDDAEPVIDGYLRGPRHGVSGCMERIGGETASILFDTSACWGRLPGRSTRRTVAAGIRSWGRRTVARRHTALVPSTAPCCHPPCRPRTATAWKQSCVRWGTHTQ